MLPNTSVALAWQGIERDDGGRRLAGFVTERLHRKDGQNNLRQILRKQTYEDQSTGNSRFATAGDLLFTRICPLRYNNPIGSRFNLWPALLGAVGTFLKAGLGL